MRPGYRPDALHTPPMVESESRSVREAEGRRVGGRGRFSRPLSHSTLHHDAGWLKEHNALRFEYIKEGFGG
jgi:hypothetical protein